MEWESYRAELSATELPRADALLVRHGPEAIQHRLRFHLPPATLGELERALEKDSRRVRHQIPGLYESISIAPDESKRPAGWRWTNALQEEEDGTVVCRTDLIDPRGARGWLERGFSRKEGRIELRNAFLRSGGVAPFVEGGKVSLTDKGTPTVQFFTLYQLKLLEAPAGATAWWRRALSRLGLREGAFAVPGLARTIRLSTIQNLDAIVHLHWLRMRFPGAPLDDLVSLTESVEYAETTAVQCGYRVAGVAYLPAKEWDSPIGGLMEHFEGGHPEKRAANDALLVRYSFDRGTAMKQNYDIELALAPIQGG